MVGIIEAFIFLCVFWYLLKSARAKEMVDVLQNYMQDAISLVRMQRTDASNHDEHGTTDYGAKRRANEKQRLRHQYNEQEKQSFDRSLYQIKDTSLQTLQIPTSALNGLARKECIKPNCDQVDADFVQQDVINVLRVGTYNRSTSESHSIFKWSTWFPFLSHCLHTKRYNYIQVADAVLKDKRLEDAIKVSVDKQMEENSLLHDDGDFDEDEQYDRILNEQRKRVHLILMDMRSKISDLLLRVASFVVFKLLPMFMSGVIAHPAHIEMLKKVSKSSPNVPLIFLPLHRSHLDYILISFILCNNNIRAPIVAAGDNLRIPFFGSLLRGLGAFFIKRKIDPVAGKKDIVYRAVLHTYMQRALSAGHNVEFFIEGGRTRTGKPCMPKSGVLSVVIDALNADTITDALLVPVSMNYERLCDGNFVYEQLGEKKKPEKFTRAVAAIWKTLNSKYGQVRIEFNEPFSLRELVKAYEKTLSETVGDTSPKAKHANNARLKHQPSTSSLFGTDVVDEEHRAVVDSIARHVVYDCGSATACMTTNAVAYLLLTRFRDGDTIDVLADALDDLRKTLKGVRAISFTGDSHDVIEYVANLFGPTLISSEQQNGKQFIKPVDDVRAFIELSYYSNSLAAHFSLDAVVMCTLLKISSRYEDSDSNPEFQISKGDLIESCKKYCDMLRYEFLFCKPCQKLEDLLEDSFDRLKEQGLLSTPTKINAVEELRARRFYADFDDDSSEDAYDNHTADNITVTLPAEGHGKRVVLTATLAPYSHTYMAVVRSLSHLRDFGMMEAEFIKACVKEITSQVDAGKCKYAESISTDTIRNCIKMLEKSCFIEISNVGGARVISLNKNYDTADGVSKITQQIESLVIPLDK